MRIGMVGLGRMGANMTRRLDRGGHEVVAYDRDPAVAGALAAECAGVTAAGSVDDLVAALDRRRAVWVMVPAGTATAETVAALTEQLDAADVIVNGGNCRWTDSQAYAGTAAAAEVVHLDAGVSGGVWGLDHGYCLMLGGDEHAYRHVEPVLATLAPPGGYSRVGGDGAGHFAKMVHNGIEYAMLQAYAEGFDLLDAAEFDYDLAGLAELWRHGSVVRSWLLDLLRDVLATHDGDLSGIAPYVEDSGEGRWTVEAGIAHAVPQPAVAAALFARFASRRQAFGDRLIAALRQEFGGHAVRGPGA